MTNELQELLALDANIPPETVPTLLEGLEKLQGDMRMVDNHLLIIARSMHERSQVVNKKIRAERRAAFYGWTMGVARRAARVVGRVAVAVVTAPVKVVRARFVKSIDEPKPAKTPAKRTRRNTSSAKRTRGTAAAPASAPAT